MLRRLLFLVVIVILLASGFCLIEKWSWLDSIWFTAMVLSTVGVSTPHNIPLSDWAQAYSIGVIFLGIGAVGYIAKQMVQDLLAEEDALRKRIQHRINLLCDHYIICGYGRVGQAITKNLAAQHKLLVVIEKDPQIIDELKNSKILYLAGDLRDETILDKAGVKRAHALVACLAPDADNVFVVLSARDANPDLFILARSPSPSITPKLRRVGADMVIEPFEAIGQHFTQALLRPAISNFLQTWTQHDHLELSLEEIPIHVDSSLVNKLLKDAPIRQKLNIIICAIQHADGTMSFNPSSDSILQANDVLIAMGEHKNIKKLEKLAAGGHL